VTLFSIELYRRNARLCNKCLENLRPTSSEPFFLGPLCMDDEWDNSARVPLHFPVHHGNKFEIILLSRLALNKSLQLRDTGKFSPTNLRTNPDARLESPTFQVVAERHRNSLFREGAPVVDRPEAEVHLLRS
jgi:hypothetical protein